MLAAPILAEQPIATTTRAAGALTQELSSPSAGALRSLP
jgi:hypothetical protein